jgi:protein-tyrosine phosphatase
VLVAQPDLVVDEAPQAPPSTRRLRWLHLQHALLTVFAFLLLGNVSIIGLAAMTRYVAPAAAVTVPVEGVGKLTQVDDKVWRGAAPSLEGYRSLADAGVTTVVDLRAEEDAGRLDAQAAEFGLDIVHLPIRDGQLPTDLQIAAFHQLVEHSNGRVFLHCGAGVGRTGAMAAAYLVQEHGASSRAALAQNLAVGPPSLEQIAFAVGLDEDGVADRPPAPIVALSRVLDAPRRIWSSIN